MEWKKRLVRHCKLTGKRPVFHGPAMWVIEDWRPLRCPRMLMTYVKTGPRWIIDIKQKTTSYMLSIASGIKRIICKGDRKLYLLTASVSFNTNSPKSEWNMGGVCARVGGGWGGGWGGGVIPHQILFESCAELGPSKGGAPRNFQLCFRIGYKLKYEEWLNPCNQYQNRKTSQPLRWQLHGQRPTFTDRKIHGLYHCRYKTRSVPLCLIYRQAFNLTSLKVGVGAVSYM